MFVLVYLFVYLRKFVCVGGCRSVRLKLEVKGLCLCAADQCVYSGFDLMAGLQASLY